ncbi:MAG: DUF6384 family protein [Planctomycetota bacterium]
MSAVPGPAPESLPELLRIMDVATALRHEREKASAMLDLDSVKASLRQRLRATADAMGDAVSDAEIDVAIERYFRQLHQYEDPPPSLQRALAHLYIRRRPILAGALAVGALVAVAVWLFAYGPWSPAARKAELEQKRAALHDSMQRRVDAAWEKFVGLHTLVLGLTREDETVQEANALRREAEAARHAGMTAALEQARVKLDALRADLEEDYVVRIVNRPNQDSGTTRGIDGRVSGYYLVVEAVTETGKVLRRSIRDAETNTVRLVDKWGEEVPKEVYDRVAADKRRDGIIDDDVFARKRRGHRHEQVVMRRTTDGPPLTKTRQITSV